MDRPAAAGAGVLGRSGSTGSGSGVPPRSTRPWRYRPVVPSAARTSRPLSAVSDCLVEDASLIFWSTVLEMSGTPSPVSKLMSSSEARL